MKNIFDSISQTISGLIQDAKAALSDGQNAAAEALNGLPSFIEFGHDNDEEGALDIEDELLRLFGLSGLVFPPPPDQTAIDNWIRENAYYRWQAAGCPEGDGVEFWLAAEQEYYLSYLLPIRLPFIETVDYDFEFFRDRIEGLPSKGCCGGEGGTCCGGKDCS